MSASQIGLGITVFVIIQVADHSIRALTRFVTEIAAMDEVMDCYRMAGDDDYILRVIVPDKPSFDDFFKRLIDIIPLKTVTSRFALGNIKCDGRTKQKQPPRRG